MMNSGGRLGGADSDAPTVAQSPAGGKYDRLIDYYESAGPDYEEWSPAFNMHFGFYRRGSNPFRREPMLAEMNRQVLDRLELPRDREHLILDLGCGVGATVRYAAVMFPLARIVGITVVPGQVAKGNAWNLRLELYPRAKLELADYNRTGLPAACADGAVAIESECHADGPDKEPFIREAARILRPGARLVVADGFLKDDVHSLDPLSRRLHQALCRSFVLPELGQIARFTDTLRRHGFQDITVNEISWRVAPSALQAPLAVLSFSLKKALRRERLSEQSVNNLRGSLLSAALGLNRRKVGYFLVTARR